MHLVMHHLLVQAIGDRGGNVLAARSISRVIAMRGMVSPEPWRRRGKYHARPVGKRHCSTARIFLAAARPAPSSGNRVSRAGLPHGAGRINQHLPGQRALDFFLIRRASGPHHFTRFVGYTPGEQRDQRQRDQ
jgi:hypothetical protein